MARWTHRLQGWLSNAADAVFRAVAPRRAAMRAHFRRMVDDPDYAATVMALMRARGYKASDPAGDKSGGWRGRPSHPDTEVLGAYETMQMRARELMQNNPIASGLAKTFADEVVGHGVDCQALTADQGKNDRIDQVWREIRDGLSPTDGWQDYAEAQRHRYKRAFEDGEIFVVLSEPDPEGPLMTQTVEADRIRTPYDAQPQDPLGSIRAGVEKDRWGRTMAYWIGDVYPSESLVGSKNKNIHAPKYERIEAWRVHHRAYRDRPGQSRGVTRFHAVLQDLQDLDLLIVAALKRVQISACLSVFLKSPASMDSFMSATAEEYGYALDQELEPGMMFKLFPGEEVSTLVPNFPTPEFEPFVVLLARRIGAAFGVSWTIVLKDFSHSNYSSARADMLEAWKTYDVEQSSLTRPRGLFGWERYEALKRQRTLGEPRLQDCSDADLAAANWIFPIRKWVDPQKEALGLQIKKSIGLFTLQDEASAQGKDWRDLQDQQLREELREREKREELGLPPKVDPAAPAAPPAEPETERQWKRKRPARPGRLNRALPKH